MGWMENKYWTTIEGKQLYPKDFEDKHLINTIKYIEKRAPQHKFEHELYLLSMPEPMGDGASYAVEAEQIRIERMSVKTWLEIYCNIYNLLVKEAKRRKLAYN